MCSYIILPGLADATLPPAQLHAYFVRCFPPEELPGPFIEVASQAYVYALALFFAQPGVGRPACTPGNVLAAVRYGDPEQVLGMLQHEPACVSWTLQLAELLDRGAHWQVQAVLHFIELVFAHARPTEPAERQVHAFLRAHAAA